MVGKGLRQGESPDLGRARIHFPPFFYHIYITDIINIIKIINIITSSF